MMEELYKYPRTRHLEGSRKQAGDEDLNYVRFGESDIFDKEEKRFFSTAKRREILKGAGFVHSVLVLDQGRYENPDQITSWIGPSHFISSDPKKNLEEQCRKGSARLEETFSADRSARAHGGHLHQGGGGGLCIGQAQIRPPYVFKRHSGFGKPLDEQAPCGQ